METGHATDGDHPTNIDLVLLVSHIQQYRYVIKAIVLWSYCNIALTSFTYLVLFNIGK